MTKGKKVFAGGDEMIAADEMFWQSPPQNSSCVSLSPEPCSDSCWSDDSCEHTATCPASSKYSRHNSFTAIEGNVLITLPLSCHVEKRGRTVRFPEESVYRSILMDATAADRLSLKQEEGSAVQPHESRPYSESTCTPRVASHHRQSTDAAIQRITRHHSADRIVGRIGPSLTRRAPRAVMVQARHFFHDKD